MLEILLYFLAPFVGLLPLDRLFNKRVVIVLTIIFLAISVTLIYPILFTGYYYADTNINILVKAMALASIGLFFGQLTNLSDKKSLIVGIGIIALIYSSLFGGFKYFGSLLNHKLDNVNQWIIEDYQVACYGEIGIAGPAITKYTLYQTKLNGHLKREISSTVENDDAVCIIKFEDITTREKYYFDKCNVTIKK